MKLDLSKYDPLRKDITRLLRNAIIRGELSPGERLIEPEIADKLGVSRTPVREALLKLESEGFVKFIPRKGAVVAPYSIKDVSEIYELLIELESLAAKKATPFMTPEHLEQIISLEQRFENATDHMEKSEANSAFHQYYINLCGNELLRDIVSSLNQKLDRYRMLVFADRRRVSSGLLEHKKIIESFQKKNASLVARLVRRHLDASRKTLISTLKKIKLEGGNVED
ncbi:GntR family transcriptional regulator [Candidatus Sumerlaeota bacterium]|nr:GntR family transcriptional regulator [Candidatus Sumerlaeota bacterium]